MPYPLITRKQLEEHIGKITVQRVYDDQQIGTASEDPVSRLLKSASSKVLGALGALYSVDAIRDMDAADVPDEITRVTLDCAEMMVVKRYPEASRNKDWEALMRSVNADLQALRTNQRFLDKSPPVRTIAPEVDSEELRGW